MPQDTCPKCQGLGKDLAAPAVRAKVPNTVPGMPRYKLVQPLCPACGGAGIKLQEVVTCQ